ncbi:MAG: dephospho-CoA kinase [Coriobacteriia bacterium]|nr:dephospho-CoA kinase [Coriobacteriia bacterium]
MIIVVTGPICAGKSTYIAHREKELQEQGVAVRTLPLDTMGHSVLTEIYGPNIDRAWIAQKVFSDPEELKKLEEIVHPLVFERAHRYSEEFLTDNPDGVVLIETAIPLSETDHPWIRDAQFIVLDEPFETRLERALNRGMSTEQFVLRDNAQRKYRYE